MKIIVLNGSPQGRKSTTYTMVEEFLKGTRKGGWSDEHILLSEMKIHHCMGCFHCWRNKGVCIFKDDMQKFAKIKCDVLMLASPLFFDNVSGLMKNFLDRLVAFANPQIECDENGESIHLKDVSRPKLLAMSNCGFPEQTHFDVLKLLFRRIARNMGTELIGEIYRGQGPLIRINDPHLEKIIQNYKSLLQVAGEEMAAHLTFSTQTKQKLEKPLIPYKAYLAAHNCVFAK